MSTSNRWEFWIDVGGTFTDCIARSPNNELQTLKTLSSGIIKGQIESLPKQSQIIDPLCSGVSADFWRGYAVRFLNADGQSTHSSRLTGSDGTTGSLTLADELPNGIGAGTAYELESGEPAPIVAIRRILGLRLDQPLPPVSLKLGTTRGTNALLERKGAWTAFLTTRGFADVLLIGNQNRPRLFDLAIQKPSPLFETVVEIDERLAADGSVLTPLNTTAARQELERLYADGVESIAICLLHAFANPEHERQVAEIAREVGFDEISVSSRLAPLIKIVSRGDTTVMDAYLNPILRDYVRSIRDALGDSNTDSRLQLMTSAGGLVGGNQFVGKDSILSGPAGGVIGFSRVALAAGFPKAIGFDMGGTSTDVARFDGTRGESRYEMEYETEKAGVRVVAPMLAIETVAAGGGSLCGFDGVKLFVGPESAGAVPGPACYGRGGPLTVTDVNLYLGRILPTRFPFPLDREAVEQRLQSLCDRIAASPLGADYTPTKLAAGFVEIANANMVRAIRRISVAKGYDPSEYALVTFGGAGAQHACEIADQLGVQRILIHPFAGILSAYGIGLADVRRFAEHAVLEAGTDEALRNLGPSFEEMESRLRSEIQSEGVPAEYIQPPRRSLDLRYAGVESVINIPIESADGLADIRDRYEQQHEQRYGYKHRSRELEITAARVEMIGSTPEPPDQKTDVVPRTPAATETTAVVFGATEHETGVYLRSDLHPGDTIPGPAIICEPTSTVIVKPDYTATIQSRGEIVLARVETSGTDPVHRDSSPDANADPVLLEIFNNLFASIAEQMGLTLQQTSCSTNVKERLDFSCAIFSPSGNLVVNAPHIPVHLGAMSETVKRILKDCGPEMQPGDVFVTNDPYRGGSHLPDVTVVTPVYDEDTQELLFFTASRAHHAEIGGIVPGSMPPFSKNLAEEGVLIRNFKLIASGESREDELKELLQSGPYPTRSVADNLADVSAQVAANTSGVRQLRELIAHYSLPVVQAYMGHIQRAAAEKMRLALRDLPDGEHRFTDHLDDGATICVTIHIDGDSARVDFTGTGEVLPTNLNANRAIVTAAVLYVFRCLINEDIPLNSGVLDPVEIVLPECLLNPPEHDDPAKCAAMVGGNVETSQRVVDVLLGALNLAAASQGTMNNLTFGDETFGYYETICGGSGATKDADGADGVHTHMTNTRLTDVEVIERRYPVRIRSFGMRRGSGGSGEKTGGDGIVREIEFLKPLRVSMLSERRGEFTPFGLNGGTNAAAGRNSLRRGGGSDAEDLGGKFSIDVQPGDVLIIETPGGGGCGSIQ